MRSFIFLFLILPITIFAAENYQQFAGEKINQEEQQTAPFAKEVAELAKNARQRAIAATSDLPFAKQSAKKTPQISPHKKVLIFVSFSMPEQSLRQWLNDAHQAGASVVIRGLKNNSFKETIMMMSKLLADDKTGGVDLNPVAFQDFKITQVPAVVVTDENSHDYDVVYGNVSLDYALQAIAKKHS